MKTKSWVRALSYPRLRLPLTQHKAAVLRHAAHLKAGVLNSCGALVMCCVSVTAVTVAEYVVSGNRPLMLTVG